MLTQVAARAGLPERTVRIGLVTPRARSPAGYRLDGPEEEGKLRFVRQAKALGLSLEDGRGLIAAAETGCCDRLGPGYGTCCPARSPRSTRALTGCGRFASGWPATPRAGAAGVAVLVTARSAAASTTCPPWKLSAKKRRTFMCDCCTVQLSGPSGRIGHRCNGLRLRLRRHTRLR